MPRFYAHREKPEAPSAPAVDATPAEARLGQVAVLGDPIRPTPVQVIGAVVVSAYFLVSTSSIGEQLANRFDTNLHLPPLLGLGSLFLALFSGWIARGLRSKVAVLWIAVFAWAVVGIPFSAWPAGSAGLALGSVPYHLTVLVVCAVAVSPAQVRTVLWALLAGTLILAALCAVLGETQGSRLALPLSSSNPNDLGFRFLLGAALMVFPLTHPNRLYRLGGLAGMLILVYLLFLTGSRGSFLAVLALAATLFLFVLPPRSRMALAVLAVVTAILVLVATPPATLQRLVMPLVGGDEIEGQESNPDADADTVEIAEKAAASTLTRKELMKRAVSLTVRHPIVGVGFGQFPEAVWRDSVERGIHQNIQRPHNAYLLVSSEIGLPGLVLWIWMIVLLIRGSYRTYNRVREAGDKILTAQSLAILAWVLAFFLNSFFVHTTVIDAAPVVAVALANTLAMGSGVGQPWAPTAVPKRRKARFAASGS